MAAGTLSYFVALLCVITVSEACSCAQSSPNVRFCFAEFAIKAKVVSQTVKNGSVFENRIFKLRIQKIFKGDLEAQINGRKWVRVYTPVQTSLCGVQLRTSKVYLLLGNIWDNKLRLNSCQWNQEWSDISRKQRRGVSKGKYGRNCPQNDPKSEK